MAAARQSWLAGHRAILLVGPCGMGKTFLATMIGGALIARGKRVGFFVHREELQDQAAEAFARIGIEAGIVRAGSPPTDAAFQIVSIQTAARRNLQHDFDFIFLDECHHFAAPDWLGPIRTLRERGVGLFGLTATPDRGDGRGLDVLFDDLIVVAQPRELIDLGHLVPCLVYSPPSAQKNLAEHPAKAWKTYARERQTIVFAPTIDYARTLADDFVREGARARCVDGTMHDDDRADALSAYRAGDLDVLTSVAVLTEGFDAPNTGAVITTTGASSPAALIQKVGRGMRPAPGKANCIHLDLRGAWCGLGMLPDDDRIFSLSGKAIVGASTDPADAVTQCHRCGRWYRTHKYRASVCPTCGATKQGKEDPKIKQARLELLSARVPSDARVHWLAEKIIEGRGKRKKDGTPYKALGWALAQYSVRWRHADKPTIDAAIRIADQIGSS